MSGRVTTDKLRGPHRLFYIRMKIEQVLERSRPTLVALEDYAMGARGNNMFNIGELGGVLKLVLWQNGIDVLPVPPTVMKSIVALNGRADKKGISRALAQRFGISVMQHDEADAVGLMLVGEMRCGIRGSSEIAGSTAKSNRFESIQRATIIKGQLKSIANRT